MTDAGYAVIEDSSYGLAGCSTELFDGRDRAVLAADELNRNAESAGVPVHYRMFALRELDETELWDWGLRGPDGKTMKYVHERAARNCLHGGQTLVRRRAGGEEWEEVHDQEVSVR